MNVQFQPQLYPTYQRLFQATSQIQKVASISTYAGGPFRCATLSPDGRFLTVGSDDGTLEIRMYEANTWRRVSLYAGGTAIRAMVWHPSASTTLFFGLASGNIHKITIVIDGIDIICDGIVPGYVHCLALSADGRMLAIAHGANISLVTDPFPQQDDLGTLIDIQAAPPEFDSVLDSQIPRGMYFLPWAENSLLVSSLGQVDLCVFSTVEYTLAWSIPLRPRTLTGSTAISPSGERLAIMNLAGGIDFYSLPHRRFMSTTSYTLSRRNPPLLLLVDIVFIDEETVAFGHSDGYVAFATVSVDIITGSFKPNGDGLTTPLQTLTFGVTDNRLNVFALVSSEISRGLPRRWITDIHVGQIDTPHISNIPTHVQAAPFVEYQRTLQQLTLHLSKKQSLLVLTALLAVVAAMICAGMKGRAPPDTAGIKGQVPADTATHGASGMTASSPDSRTSNICFCTISGTTIVDA